MRIPDAATGRYGPAQVALAPFLAIVLAGCPVPSGRPEMEPGAAEALRRGEGFVPDQLLAARPVALEEAPEQPGPEIARRAGEVANASTGTFVVSLPEFRQAVLAHNLALQVDLFDPALAEEAYVGETWKFEEVLSAAATYTHLRSATGWQTGTLALSPEVTVPFRTGGTFTLGLPWSQTHSRATEEAGLPNPTDSQGIDLTLSQPLLRHAWEVNVATIDAAGLRLRQADARTKLSAIRTLANAERAYWRHYAAHENLKIQLEQYEASLQQVDMAQRLVDEGVRTEVEVTRAVSGVARRFESIIRAETTRRLSERLLKTTMNRGDLPVDSKTVIVPGTAPNPMGLVFDREKVVALALYNRMELFQNELQAAIDEIDIGVSENAVLPDLRLNFTYSFSGNAPQFDQALDKLFYDDLNGYTIGASFELPLGGNQSARARLRRSQLALAQTRAARARLEQAVVQEVHDAIDAVEQNWQRILSNRLAVSLARKTYEAEQAQFRLNTITSTDVLIALTDLSAAEETLVQAIVDYQNSLVDLAFATGTVLGYTGVLWEPASAERSR